MNDYVELRLDMHPMPGEDAADYAAALLGDAGFESFVPDDGGLTAYIKKELWNAEAVNAALEDFPFECAIETSHRVIEGRDWNEEWEKNYYNPIVIGAEGHVSPDKESCVVHSSFHTDVPAARYEIVIDPKMAFGTGHHSTTSLILEQLLRADLTGKSLIDMGTGTGILAILAAMRGAHPVTAIEIDEFAYTNAVENVALNGHPEIDVKLGDATALADVEPAEFFVANINRNVITCDIDEYAKKLCCGGTMLLSGFYTEDIPVVAEAARRVGLKEVGHTVRDNWTCLKLIRTVLKDSLTCFEKV